MGQYSVSVLMLGAESGLSRGGGAPLPSDCPRLEVLAQASGREGVCSRQGDDAAKAPLLHVRRAPPPPPPGKGEEAWSANLLTLKALDYTLQVGYNIVLNMFRAQRRILSLKASEKRAHISAGDLPPEQAQHDQDRASCILDTETGPTRLEMVCELERPHTLHSRSDRRTVGWQMWFHMYTCFNIRGTFFEGEAHHD